MILTIKAALPDHLEKIMHVIGEARQIMRSNDNHTQWINGYPDSDIILKDITTGQGFICVDKTEHILGYFCFFKGDDPEPNYKNIEKGSWKNNEPYGVIHRLASNGEVKGIAKACFDFCFTQVNNIKVDTNNNNKPMQNFLRKYGFDYCGIIYVADGTPRDAFQLKYIS